MHNLLIKKEISSEFLRLSKMSAKDLISTLDADIFIDVVVDIFKGKNVRSFTEILTRVRLIKIYVELLNMIKNLKDKYSIELPEIMEIAKNDLLKNRKKITGEYMPIYNWLVVLTNKQRENVLRDEFSSDFEELIAKTEENIKKLSSTEKDRLLIYLMLFSGAMTLTIRGSEKSLHGKYFERLVLGTLLQLLGFSYRKGDFSNEDRCFILSSQDKNDRESDATVIYKDKAIKIDIGFIGRGNSEITLDKTSRYAKKDEIFGTQVNVKTIIIVDSVPQNSKIYDEAMKIDTDVFCMSDKDWVQKISTRIYKYFNLENNLDANLFKEAQELKSKIINMDVSIKDLINCVK